MITKIKSPFDLPVLALEYPVVVTPVVAALMELPDEKGGCQEQREAIWMIYGLLVPNGDNYQLNAPHHYGLSFAERKFTEKALNNQVDNQIETLELIERIAKETGVGIDEIQAIVTKNAEAFSSDPRFFPYLKDMLKIQSEQNKQVDYDRAVVTAIMKLRLGLADWTIDHSEALHDLIFNQLLEFIRAEDSLADEAGKMIKQPNPVPLATS